MITLNGKEVEFKQFPNGETMLVHESLNIGFDMKVEAFYIQNDVVFKFENDSDLIKLMFVKKYLDSFGVKVNLLITYMPYSRMDRSEDKSPFTLKYVSEFINNLDFYEVAVIEPHSDVTCALLDHASPYYINFDLIEKVKAEIGFDEERDYIVFPDTGASKRYSKMKANNVLIGSKKRDFKTGKILGLDLIGDTLHANGKIALIVDDLSSYGGTFTHMSERLIAEGITKVYLLVAHAENSIFKKDLFKHIDKVFTTDSLLTENDERFESQLHIFKLEGEIC